MIMCCHWGPCVGALLVQGNVGWSEFGTLSMCCISWCLESVSCWLPARLGIDWENLRKWGKLQGWHPTLKLGRDLSGLVTKRETRKNSANLRIRQHFIACFLVGKTAYRRANGGSTAPTLHVSWWNWWERGWVYNLSGSSGILQIS